MARINLLPWRDKLRSERQRQFIIALVGAVVLTGAGFFYVHTYVDGLIAHQNSRNGKLQREIAAADKKIQEIRQLEKRKADLLARMGIIEQLQASRPEAVHVFDELVQTIPEGVHLTQFSYRGKAINLSGAAQSNARVSTYMRNLESSPWFGDPRLFQIQKSGNNRNFAMATTQTNPNAQPANGGAAQ